MSDQKSILITGCSTGIGRCAAEKLKQRGYRVFATARKQKDVAQLIEEGFESVQLDLANTASIHSAVETILRKIDGKLYALFNNGAYGQTGAVEDLTRDVLREQFETNLFGTHELTNLVIPVMRRQGGGRIIQNSSLLGFVALKCRGAYNASKYAMEGLTDTLRMELKGSGIYVSLIEPGPIETHFRKNAYAAYKRNISTENSYHKAIYELMEQRLQTEGPVVPFTLGPEAVVKKLIQALESKKPKARYYVTLPTYLFGYLKRFLPVNILDRILEKI
jgi:NAD(P)-dependent dehydrogenase (short-subunit alcohol dehydrogenase family)